MSIANLNVETDLFGKCKICEDKATGEHYGVVTCDGCKVWNKNFCIFFKVIIKLKKRVKIKGFYRRSLSRDLNFSCSNNNKCVINMITRNRCRSCRFNKVIKLIYLLHIRFLLFDVFLFKCLIEGMSQDG